MSGTPRTIVIPGPFYGLTPDGLYLKADALRDHAERLAEALEEALYLVRLHDSSYLQNFQDALTLYRAENPKV